MSKRKRDTIWLASISATLFLSLLPYAGYISSLPLIRTQWDMSNAESGLVFSAYLIGSAVSALILVPLADKITPQRMMVSGVLFMGAANILFPLLANGPWMAIFLRYIAGSGQVVAYVLGIQLVTKRFAVQKRGSAVGLFVGTGYAGTTMSYTLFGLVLQHSSTWQDAYLLTAIAGVVGPLLTLFVAKKWASAEVVSEHPDPNEPAPGGTAAKRGRLQPGVLRNKQVLLVIIAYALHSAELYLARLWFPLLLGATLMQDGRSAAESAAPAATLSGFMFMTGIAGVLGGGVLSDKMGRSRAATLIFVLSGACSLAVGWLVGAPPSFVILIGFIYGLTTAADSAIYSTAAIELSPPDQIGSVQAAQSFIGFGVGAVVPVLAGVILDLSATSYRWGFAFSFNGILAILGVLVLLRLKRLTTPPELIR